MRGEKAQPEGEGEKHVDDSLADQALEAIIRSQQLRERSRKLRAKRDDADKVEDEKS